MGSLLWAPLPFSGFLALFKALWDQPARQSQFVGGQAGRPAMGECSATCEEPRYLGVAGKCVSDGIGGSYCECPPGFSGNDDWFPWDDCHVNEQVRYVLHMVLLCVGCVLFTVSIIGALYLLAYWDCFRPRPGVASTETTNSWVEGARARVQSQSSSATSAADAAVYETPVAIARSDRKIAKKKRLREYFSVLSLLMITAYSGSTVAYVLPYFYGRYRWEHLWYQEIALSSLISFFFISLWFYFYVWYVNLPSLRVYGKLLGVKNQLIVRPKVIKLVAVACCVFLVVSTFVVMTVLPLLHRDVTDNEYDVLLFKISQWLGFTFTLTFVVFLLMLMQVLGNLFGQMYAISRNSAAQSMRKDGIQQAFRKANTAILLMKIASWLIGVPGSIMFVVCATYEPVRENTYIVNPTLVILGNCAATLVIFFIVFKLRGPKSPRRCSKTAVSISAGVPEQPDQTASVE